VRITGCRGARGLVRSSGSVALALLRPIPEKIMTARADVPIERVEISAHRISADVPESDGALELTPSDAPRRAVRGPIT
jgi:hypothetical protein